MERVLSYCIDGEYCDDPKACDAAPRGCVKLAPERDCEFCMGTGTDHTDPSLSRCPYCQGGRI